MKCLYQSLPEARKSGPKAFQRILSACPGNPNYSPHQRLALQPRVLKPAPQLHLLLFMPAGDDDHKLFRQVKRFLAFALELTLRPGEFRQHRLGFRMPGGFPAPRAL
jgi:hypothetical protein